MKWFLNALALLSASLFLALEAIVLLYAINNQHNAYYYGFIGLGSLICVLLTRYLSRKDPPSTAGLKILQMFTHGLVYLLVLCGVLVSGLNYWLRGSM